MKLKQRLKTSVGIVFTFVFFLSGCSFLPSPWKGEEISPLFQEKKTLQTFQSQLQLLLKTPGGRVSLQGWLYLKKPSSFRIELFNRLGTLVWLLQTNGKEYYYYSFQDNTVESGRWSEIEENTGAPVPILPEELTRILLAEPMPNESNYFLKRHRKKDEWIVGKKEPSQKLAWRAHFLRFTEIEGLVLPQQLELDFPSEKLSLRISYQRPSVNPSLDIHLFGEHHG